MIYEGATAFLQQSCSDSPNFAEPVQVLKLWSLHRRSSQWRPEAEVVEMNALLRGTAIAAAVFSITQSGTAGAAPARTRMQAAHAGHVLAPLVDHHKHLRSADAARGAYPLPVAEIPLPDDLAELLKRRQSAWNKPAQLAALYSDEAVVLNTENEDLPSWIRGRSAVAEYIGTLFGRPHRIKPVAFKVEGQRGYIAGYLHRPEVDRHFGHVLLSLARGKDGQWHIEAETPTFPGPRGIEELNADALVEELDEAGVRRAVVLSVAYWFGSAFRGLEGEQEYAMVRGENDWVADQAARYPDRLISFCSVNPLKAYAIVEVRRCSERHRGLKLHLGNSRVDLRKAEHADAVGKVFAEANRLKLPIIIHLWTDPSFEAEGGTHAQAFLNRVLPNAPDVTIQVAHMAGGGRATQPALKVLAEAIAAGDQRTRNLYFDVATLVDGETPENLRLDVQRIRQIGVDRILFGSDSGVATAQGWASLHMLPLTQMEFEAIATNVAPYAR